MVNYFKLEKLLEDMSVYCLVLDTHTYLPLTDMKNTYKLIRKEIINTYDLNKGEFTTYYAMARGRK